MATATILRCQRRDSKGEVRVWYEYAPIIDGRPRRRPNHMMGSAESAADLARRDGFSLDDAILDVQL